MIGVHGIWTPGKARREARVLLGRIAQRDNPAEQRERDHRASTVKEPCECYMADAEAGLKTRRRGRAIVSGGIGTGRRTVAFLGALLTYARERGRSPQPSTSRSAWSGSGCASPLPRSASSTSTPRTA